MDWLLLVQIVYVCILFIVCLRIIYDTRSAIKTLSYLLVAVFIPVIGILIYFSFGINYRKRKIYHKKLYQDENLAKKQLLKIYSYSKETFSKSASFLQENKELALMLLRDSGSPLTGNNEVKLLINGEQKFPEVIAALENARHHIHMEYYIYEDDEIGKTIEEILIRKAKEGVTVRFIYDDFGSSSIRKTTVTRLKENGVHCMPFYKIRFLWLANSLNYRNHRKIIVIDGKVSFVGGINISDRYINRPEDAGNPDKIYWRDTHLKIEGPGTYFLQYVFLSDWNFCAKDNIEPDSNLFPDMQSIKKGDKMVQIAASGPDSDNPLIMYSLIQAIYLAQKEILITTPYFIPGESILDALIISALGGVKVKLLIPGYSDSIFVNFASRSYYSDLLSAGVEIYFYKKGFVHAKTMVTDGATAIVGTANMDQRSFDLNFEVNAIVYNKEIAEQLRDAFYEDIKDAEKIDHDRWSKRKTYIKLMEKTARLVSPML